MRVVGLLRAKGFDIHTIDPSASVEDAAIYMHEHNIGSLVVLCEQNRYLGLVTERDLVAALAENGAGVAALTVSSVMQRDSPRCHIADTLENVMALMTESRARHVPVFEDDVLVGVISIGDVVKRRLAELESEARLVQDYVFFGR